MVVGTAEVVVPVVFAGWLLVPGILVGTVMELLVLLDCVWVTWLVTVLGFLVGTEEPVEMERGGAMDLVEDT